MTRVLKRFHESGESSFPHPYFLRIVGMAEIESEWTAHDREMLTSADPQGCFPGTRPRYLQTEDPILVAQLPGCSSLNQNLKTEDDAIFRFLVYTLLAMGRQTRFHMLPEDCRRFVLFLQERDPVIVTEWHSSKLPEIQEVTRPWERGGHYCLWNQAILPALTRKSTGKYFNIDFFSSPVIEFTYESPVLESWNGQPALTQGRIWASFETESKAFEKWYNAVVRWIRKNFIRDLAVGHDRDSIGPAAYEWFKAGGLLLPNFRPPLTEAWLAWASVQNQHRTDLGLN